MKKRIRERERFAFAENKRMEHKRRIFSYSLILLFSAIGAAQGARLCQIAKSQFNDYVHNQSVYKWAVGKGCSYIAGGNHATNDATPSCQTIVASGISACADNFGNGTTIVAGPNGSGEKKYCLCKRTWPSEGVWVLHSNSNEDYCMGNCAYHCGANQNLPDSYFRTAMFAVPMN